MFEKEFREWFENNKKWLYSSDHLQAAYFAWCAGIKQQQAVEPTLAPDGAGFCACENPMKKTFMCVACGLPLRPAGKA